MNVLVTFSPFGPQAVGEHRDAQAEHHGHGGDDDDPQEVVEQHPRNVLSVSRSV